MSATRLPPRVCLPLCLLWGVATGCVSRPAAPVAAPPAAVPSEAVRRVAALLANAGCRACHTPGAEAADTRLVFPPAGAPPDVVARASSQLAELIDVRDPARSRLLRKPTRRLMHEGGQKIAPGTAEEELLSAWLAEVARAGRVEPVALRELLVAPPPFAWPVRYQGTPGRLRRLSRDELVTTLEVLLGVAPPRDELPEEPRARNGLSLATGVPLVASELLSLTLAMKGLATKVSPALLESSGCDASAQPQRACLLRWSERLAERAFRRPSTAVERGLFASLLSSAGESRDGDVAAVEMVVGTILQSPSLLYRSELGTPARPGLRALDGAEIATRLAYLTTQAPPDDALAEAARAGRLADPGERIRQLERLAATPLGRRARTRFVLEWLGASDDQLGRKDPRYLRRLQKNVAARGIVTDMRRSAEDTIERVLAGAAPPTVGALLTTTAYQEDDAIALLAANDANTAGAEPPARVGLLMHPHVLAAHTKENGSSPFQIGAFLRESLLCEPVPAPPPDAAALARSDEPAGLTTRESLEHRTSVGRACTGCHRTFAPLGYAFLAFDPVGRWIPNDPTGRPWDLAGHVDTFSGVPLAFSSPAALVSALAEHPQVHGCFAQAAVQWTLGRPLVPDDEPLVAAAGRAAQRTRGDVAEIFRAIVADPGFVHVIAPR